MAIPGVKFPTKAVTKWLSDEESSVLCNVVTTGDILELDSGRWGVALRLDNARDKGPSSIEVATLFGGRVVKEPLKQFWVSGTQIRINNTSDRTQQHHEDKQIRQQVDHALRHPERKWHNDQHFVIWCRHGDKVPDRQRQASDAAKWGSLSASAGVWMFIKKRQRRNTE